MKSLSQFVRVLYEPGTVFEEIKESPQIWLPILLLIILNLGYLNFYLHGVDPVEIFNQQLENSGKADQLSNLTEQQKENIVNTQTSITRVSPILYVPGLLALLGLYFFIVAKISGREMRFSQGMAVAVYANAVSLVSIAIGFLIMLLTDYSNVLLQDLLPSNLGYFLSADSLSKSMHALMKSLDFFVIWMLTLMTIGLSIIGKYSKATSGLIVFIPWILIVGVSVLLVSLY